MSVDEYKQAILTRNPFSPPNAAPSLDLKRSYEVTRETDFELDLAELIKDPENQLTNVELLDQDALPEGLRLRGKSVRWRPRENGKYEIPMRISDTGWPSASREKTLVLNVVDPAPVVVKDEKPKFDRATRTKLTACVGGGRNPVQAWVHSQTDGKDFDLFVGSEFEYEGIKGTVININHIEDYVEFETDDRRWIFSIDDESLAEAYQRGLSD